MNPWNNLQWILIKQQIFIFKKIHLNDHEIMMHGTNLFFHLSTLWGWDKMDAIFQTTILNAFSWMKMYKFWLIFHWSLLPRVHLTIFQHWSRWWLGAVQATSHYLNQCWHRLPTHIWVPRPQWVNLSHRFIVNFLFKKKLPWNLNQNTNFLSQKSWVYHYGKGIISFASHF